MSDRAADARAARRGARRVAAAGRGCTRDDAPRSPGGWIGAERRARPPAARRLAGDAAAPAGRRATRRVGARRRRRHRRARRGARAAAPASTTSRVLELEDSAGGNSRGRAIGGHAPARSARTTCRCRATTRGEVQRLLDELGAAPTRRGPLRSTTSACCATARRSGCSSTARWHEGLLPPSRRCRAERDDAGAVPRASPPRVDAARRATRFAIPTARARWRAAHRRARRDHLRRLARREGPRRRRALRWYLDYCCRDDYGAGSARRLGLGRPALLRQPARLSRARRRARASARRVLPGPRATRWLARAAGRAAGRAAARGPRRAARSREGRHGVEVDAWNVATRASSAGSARAVHRRAAAVRRRAPARSRRRRCCASARAHARYAPWLVANLQLARRSTTGPAPRRRGTTCSTARRAWAMSTRCTRAWTRAPGPTVLTWYRALGERARGSARCSTRPWRAWRDELLAELSRAASRPARQAQARRGGALRPCDGDPGAGRAGAGRAGVPRSGRLAFAHGDWSGYSVFEEAFTRTATGRAWEWFDEMDLYGAKCAIEEKKQCPMRRLSFPSSCRPCW